jgi:hypothetical protein
MEHEALKQLLASVDINPDEIKLKDMPEHFAFYFLSLKCRTKRLNSSRQRTKSFETKSTYSKVNKANLRFVALKRRIMTYLLKKSDKKDGFHRARNLNQN